MSEHKIPIPGRIYNASGGNVCGTDDIIDDVKGKKQSQINTEVDNAIQNEIERATEAESDRYTKSEVIKPCIGLIPAFAAIMPSEKATAK